MYSCKVGTRSCVLINQVALFQRCPLREVPLYSHWSLACMEEPGAELWCFLYLLVNTESVDDRPTMHILMHT